MANVAMQRKEKIYIRSEDAPLMTKSSGESSGSSSDLVHRVKGSLWPAASFHRCTQSCHLWMDFTGSKVFL